MKKDIKYLELFYSLFIINSITFGGGYTIIPIIKDEFVFQKKCISEKEMDDIVTLAQSIPGVMTISTSFLVGYNVLGILGAIIATVAAILPCFIVIALISVYYTDFIENIYIKRALSGISGSIVALLILTIIKSIKNELNSSKKYFYIIINIAVFSLKLFFDINILYIVLICGFIGYLYNRGEKL